MEIDKNKTDIMVGDWVKIQDQEEDPLYNKGWLTTQIHDADDLADIINEGWEPIPITPEILEKIGFKNKGVVAGATWEFDGYYLNYDDSELLIFWSTSGRFDVSDIRYVHELQHALRLCKIDKEIELC